MTAASCGGVASALRLGALFTLGMLLVDGLHGWWIAHLISRADRLTALASRIMAFVVAGIGLGVGALGVARLRWPAVGAWSKSAGWLLGAGVFAALRLGSVAALRWQRPVHVARQALVRNARPRTPWLTTASQHFRHG